MLRFTILSALVFVVGWLVRLNSPQNIFGILQGFGFVGLLISGVHFGLKIFRVLLRRILWKVRNKIIISFAFV